MKTSTTMKIDPLLVSKLKKLGDIHTYSTTTELFYKNQVPIVAYLLLSGNAYIERNKRIVQSVEINSIIGLKEVVKNQPTNYSVTVLPNSTVCFLSLSTLFSIIKTDDLLGDELESLIAI